MFGTSSHFSQLKFLAVAGVGLFGDGFLNLSIGLGTPASPLWIPRHFLTPTAVPMLGYLYFHDEKNKVPTVPGDLIKASLSIGMILGQIGFGVFGDALGRHRIYGKELIITIIGSLMVILMPWKNFSHSDVVA